MNIKQGWRSVLKRSIDHFQDWLAQWGENRTRGFLAVVLAVLTGFLVGLVVDTLAHRVGDFIFPPPPILDMADRDQLQALYDTMPIEAFWVQILSWSVGTLAGGYTAVRMAKTGQFPAWMVGVLLLAGYMIGMLWLHNPMWLVILCPLLVAACAWAGGWLGMYVNVLKERRALGKLRQSS